MDAKAKQKKTKGGSKVRKHSSNHHANEQAPGSREQHHSSPSKPHNGPSGPGGEQHTRSSTAGNQIVLSDPSAAFVLVATQEFVRVYSITHAVSGDRTTMRKVAMQGPLRFASAFMACGSPALACLLEVEGEVHLQVGTVEKGCR